MAFPQIADADTKSGTVTSNSSSWTLTYPTNIAVGDLIVAFVAMDGSTQTTFPANWTRIAGRQSAVSLAVAFKVGLGSETGTFTLTLSATEQGGWRIFRITGWRNDASPFAGAQDLLATSVQVDGSSTSLKPDPSGAGGDANPNPGSCDPSNWATEDTLWFAACGVDTSRTISVYPLAGRNTADVSGGSTGATLGLCTTESATSSLDPGTFTISAADDWSAATVAIRPAAAVAAFAPPFRSKSIHNALVR